jgi:hypothetical protein
MENWISIFLTSILYRVIFRRFAKVIQQLDHEKFPISDDGQKGFRSGVAGCLEHNCVVNVLIDDAMKFKKELFIISLDFKDAFGSVKHEILKCTLEKTGLNREMTSVILDSYVGSSTKIVASKGMSDQVIIDKGIKQGCPLSPTLFHMCIDPLLRRLHFFKKELDYGFGHDNTEHFNAVQAYADDALLFSNSRENLDRILEIVYDFFDLTKIYLNAKICAAFEYWKADGEYVEPVRISDVGTKGSYPLSCVNGDDTFKYLSISLGKN